MVCTQILLPLQLLLLLQATAVVEVVVAGQGSSWAPSVYDYYDFLEIPRAEERADDLSHLPAQRGPRFQPNPAQFKPSPIFKPSPPFQPAFKPKPAYREHSKPVSPHYQPKTKPRYQEIGGFRRPAQRGPNTAFSRPGAALSRQNLGHLTQNVNKPNFKPVFSPNQGERPPLAQEWPQDSSDTGYYYQEEEESPDGELFQDYDGELEISPNYREEGDPFHPRFEKSPLTHIYEEHKPSFRPKYEEDKPFYPRYEDVEDRGQQEARYEGEEKYEEDTSHPSREKHNLHPIYEEDQPTHPHYREIRPTRTQYEEDVPSHPRYTEDEGGSSSYPEYRVETGATVRETTPDYLRYEAEEDGGFRPIYREDEGLGGGGGAYREEEEAPIYPYKEDVSIPRLREGNYQPKVREESSLLRPSIFEEETRKRRREEEEEEEEAVIEKREVLGHHGHLDANGRDFVAEAAKVEGGKGGEGRLAFQIHGQEGPHSYRFGYDTGKGYNRQFRYEERDGHGQVHGRYGFYDKDGKLQIVNYSAHPKHGFSADVPHS